MVCELNERLTGAQIANEVGVDQREVWRWKAGERRPMGMLAVKVYLLHLRVCPSLSKSPLMPVRI